MLLQEICKNSPAAVRRRKFFGNPYSLRCWVVFLLLIAIGSRSVAQTDTIADQRLDEVVVIAKIPEVQIKADKITYRLQSSITRSRGSVYDVLSTLPGVRIHADGTIYLNGQSGANILLDGKPTYLSGIELTNLLKTMPAATVDKIDLIDHPSARYDAAGSTGLIDIHAKKIQQHGFNLSVNSDFHQGIYPQGYGSVSFNFRKEKLNFFATYSYSQGRERVKLQIDRAFTDPLTDVPTGVELDQSSLRRSRIQSHYYRAGMDYILSPRTTIGIETSGDYYERDLRGDMDARFASMASASDSTLFTYNRNDRRTSNQTVGLYVDHLFDAEGRKLDASVDYLTYDYTENQWQNDCFRPLSSAPLLRDTLRGKMDGRLNLYTGQFHLHLPAFGPGTIEAGAKTTWVDLDNTARYANAVDGQWIPNDRLSNRYVYKENVNAGYVQWSGTFRSLHIEAGLRVENTRIDGRQSDNGLQADTSFTQRYTHLFPTFLASYGSGIHQWAVFYGRRIGRPSYRDLNPFLYLFDKYTYEQGNPSLKPELSDQIELAYIRQNMGKLALFYVHTKDVTVKNFILEEGNRVIVSAANYPSSYRAGARLNTVDLSILAPWRLSFSLAAVSQRFRWLENGRTTENNRLGFVGTLNQQFVFPHGWSIECNLSYQSKMAAAQATLLSVFQADAGIKKEIAGGKGTIRLYGRDLFGTDRRDMYVRAPMQNARVAERSDRTCVGISFSYRWNRGTEIKKSSPKNEVDERKRINL